MTSTAKMDESRRTDAPAESEGPSSAELKLAREAVAALATAAKSFTLYPAGHVMSTNQIDTLIRTLSAFFAQADKLMLEISRDGLTYRDHLLYKPLPADDPLLPPLLRDGFLWIAIEKGVDPDQMAFFLERLNRYRILVDEPEGDLVTELWQADLKHIRYDAIEEFWDVKPQFDFSHFQVCPMEAEDSTEAENSAGDWEGNIQEPAGGDDAEAQKNGSEQAAIQIAQSTNRRVLMRLSEKERASIKSQVADLETQDHMAIVREILLFTLSEQADEGEFSQILKLLQDLLFDLLYHQQPGHFHDLLRGLRVLQKNTRIAWQRNAVGKFIKNISTQAVWEGQVEFFRDLHALSSAEQQQVARFINLLAPVFISVLAPELGHIRGSALHQTLLAAGAKLASRNIQTLESCISGAEETTLKQVVLILGEMKGERAQALLERMGRHPAGAVRETAVKTLLARTKLSDETLLHYLADRHFGVRAAVLDHIGRMRSANLERALRDYIEHNSEAEEDEDHLLGCYKALGKCSSRSTVTYLGEVLLNRSAGSLLQFNASPHRVGAALALRHSAGQEAQEFIQKAAKSLFPAIRSAHRKAMAL